MKFKPPLRSEKLATNKVRLVVSDLSGRIVMSENRNVEAGENKLELNVNNLLYVKTMCPTAILTTTYIINIMPAKKSQICFFNNKWFIFTL